MGKFAAQVKDMNAIANHLAQLLVRAKEYNASLTGEVRAFLAKVEKQEGKLAGVAQDAADGARYLKKLDEKDYPSYEQMLKDAEKKKNDDEVKRVKGLLADGDKRGPGILEDGKKLLERWNKYAVKHKAAVDKVKAGFNSDLNV